MTPEYRGISLAFLYAHERKSMPKVRFIRGIVFQGEPVGPPMEMEVSDRDAQILCEGYKDAVRIDGEAPKPASMTTKDVIVDRQVTASNRDPSRKK
jgi:hypothetical protein